MAIIKLEKPQPDYRLRTATRRVVLRYHRENRGFKFPEGTRHDEWNYPSSEDYITLEMLKEVHREGPGRVSGYGKVAEMDIENKILCMEGTREVLIEEIKALRDRVEKLEGDRVKHAATALGEAIIQLEM